MSTGKVYTRTGDQGETCLIGGTRVPKSDLRLEASGTVDELNSWTGLLASELRNSAFADQCNEILTELEKIQVSLFDIGSHVSCNDVGMLAHLPKIHDYEITALETSMDKFSVSLAPLKNFILPGGHSAASIAHLARTVTRRAERACVRVDDLEGTLLRYLNRLSDYFFVLARYINFLASENEILWKTR